MKARSRWELSSGIHTHLVESERSGVVRTCPEFVEFRVEPELGSDPEVSSYGSIVGAPAFSWVFIRRWRGGIAIR
ncbi:MAG: hypothetical protein AAF546_12065 [Verrucomicrobiota bacterium]